jgi:hypothetical protein
MNEIKTERTGEYTQTHGDDPCRHADRAGRIGDWMLPLVYTDEDADRTFVG